MSDAAWLESQTKALWTMTRPELQDEIDRARERIARGYGNAEIQNRIITDCETQITKLDREVTE